VALVKADVLEEGIAFIIRVIRINEIETTELLDTASVVPSSLILFT
jgi:hypothetical protein